MSRCPDWTALAHEREANPLADPAGWSEARAHLADCADCRRTALDADPLFLFAGLSPAAEAAPAPRAADLAAMQGSVLALVRASRVAPDAARRPHRGARLARYAAALLVTSLLALSGAERTPPAALASLASETPPVAPAAAEESAAFVDSADFAQPMLEELDRPEARVYELSNADLAVVMIVDAGLDV